MRDNIDFVVGNDEPDTALFRAAGLRVYADVSGKKFDVSDLMVQGNLNFIPRANFKLSLGYPSGEAQPEIPDYSVFVRYAAVKLILEVEQLEDGGQYVRPAMPAGSYTIFDGIIESVTPSRSFGSIDLQVSAQHRMVQVMSGGSLFSPFIPNNLQAVNVLYGGLTTSRRAATALRVQDDPWVSIMEALESIFQSAKVDNKIYRDSPDFARLEESNTKALELLKSDVSSYLQLAFSSDNLRNSLGVSLYASLEASLRNRPNLWALLTELGREMDFMLVPTADKILVIPNNPFAPSESEKVGFAGSLLASREAGLRNGSDFSMIVGTLIVGGRSGNTTMRSGAPTGLRSYVAPAGSYDSRYGVAAVVDAPAWLTALPNVVSRSRPGMLRLQDTRPRSIHSPGGQRTDDVVAEAEAPALEDLSNISYRYSRLRTLEALFTEQQSLMTGLRLDIVPGQQLRYTVVNANGDARVFHGRVAQVSLSIGEGGASTTIDVDAVRTDEQQRTVIEQGDAEHPIFQDVTTQISALRWSS